MKKIAITGGICSGKTTLCKHLEKLGHIVFYSDSAAIHLATNNTILKRHIIKEFGSQSYLPSGEYNRKYIGDIVFGDKIRLNRINEMFKPFISHEFEKFMIDKCSGKTLVFYESALVFENNIYDQFDYIIGVHAPRDVVIERLRLRNNFSDDEIIKRLNSQLDPNIKLEKSDYVVSTINRDFNLQLNYILTDILS